MVDPFFIPWVNISFQNLANRSLVDDTFRKVNGLKPIAAELGVSLAQLSIAWCASNPNVSSVITGATKESQVQFTNPCLSEECFFKQVFLNR
jgi:aryl-alcohol dehydrogenase-like predicted oxidoreductase